MNSKLDLAQEYKILDARIYSERLGDDVYVITPNVIELSLFEDIELPYISGRLVVSDYQGSFNEMALKGTETVYIKLEGGGEENYDTNVGFDLEMKISSIIRRDKITERIEGYTLNLISPIAFKDRGIKISKSFKGKLTSMITKIIQNYHGAKVNWNYLKSESSQEPSKVISPYLSPLEMCMWLLDRATTVRGVPYYLWQSIYEQSGFNNQNLRLGSLDHMMNGGFVWNEDVPLVYAEGRAQDAALLTTYDQAFIIKKFEEKDIEDTTRLMESGSIGSQMTVLDTFTGQSYSKHFSVSELLKRGGKDIMYQDVATGLQNVYDEELTLEYQGENKPSDQWNNVYFDTLTSYGNNGNNYGYHDDPRELDAMNKVRANAIRNLMDKNAITMVTPGASFFRPMVDTASKIGVGAGDVTKVEVYETDTSTEEINIDHHRSGYYMIQKCRHTFQDGFHTVISTVSKIHEYY
jgi:hypothetical protein